MVCQWYKSLKLVCVVICDYVHDAIRKIRSLLGPDLGLTMVYKYSMVLRTLLTIGGLGSEVQCDGFI